MIHKEVRETNCTVRCAHSGPVLGGGGVERGGELAVLGVGGSGGRARAGSGKLNFIYHIN